MIEEMSKLHNQTITVDVKWPRHITEIKWTGLNNRLEVRIEGEVRGKYTL